MESATSTNQQSTKRTRFATNNPGSGTNNTNTNNTMVNANTNGTTLPPKGLAESFVRSHATSLHPDIATIVERLGKEHLTLLSKLDNKRKQVQRMADDDNFIPRSARIDFVLKVSKRAEESPEFIALDEETSSIVEKFQKDLKEQIVKAAKIEITAIESDLKEHLAKSSRLIAKSFMIHDQDDSDVDDKVYILMDRFIVDLSINIPMAIDAFTAIYKKIHDIEAFPATQDAATMETGDSIVLNALRNRQQQRANIPPIVTKIKETMEAVFVSAWSQYKAQQQKNEIALDLKKPSTGFFTERATVDAITAVDNEVAADKQELKALIRQETRAEKQDLKKQLNELKQEISALKSAKNAEQRGRGGASTKKTNQPSTTPSASPTTRKGRRNNSKESAQSTTQTRPNRNKNNSKQGKGKGEKAADSNNESTDGSSGSKKQPGNNNSTRKRSRSRKKKNESSAPSSRK
jgi:hypothetical protein